MTEFKWPASGSGSGTVSGPVTSTDNAVARFDGTNGQTIQNSPVTIDDSGNVVTPGTVDGRDVSVDGATLDSHVANLANPHSVTKSQVGLGNVDNTSDATKNAAVATLTNKTITAPVITSPTGIVKGDVGLGNVDNTSDANKPVSTAQQTALNLKANIASPTFTGTVTIPSGSSLGTPSSLTLTSATGLPVGSGISGLGAGIATFLASPTSGNLISAVTDETGTGALVFANSPQLTTPNLGTPSAGVLTNASGLPLTTGVTGVLPSANGGSPTTTKGDLATFSTVNARLGVGTDTQVLTADSTTATGLKWATPSAGSGEKNYITTGVNSATGWTSSGAGMAVTTDSTATNFPDNSTQTTAIKFLRASGTDYAYYRFTLDKADYNKKLKIQKDLAYAGTAGDYTVRVFSNTASNYAGTSTELTVSPSTSVPTGTGQMQMSFDSSGSTAPYLEIRVYGVAGTTALYVNNFLVGPGVLGSQVADYDDLVVTMTANTTNTTVVATETRKGAKATYRVLVTFSGVPGAAGLVLSLPSGRTINTTALLSSSTATLNILPGSSGVFYDVSLSTGYPLQVDFTTTSSVTPLFFDDTATGVVIQDTIKNATPVTVASGDTVTLNFTVPIAEWAGSGTLSIGAGAQVEYASTSGTWDADSSATVTGSSGQAIGGALTSNRTKTVTWTTPIQVDDIVIAEIDADGSGRWVAALGAYSSTSNLGVTPLTYTTTGTGANSVGLITRNTSATTTVVVFGRYYNASLDGSTVLGAWSDFSATSARWRVRKVKASSPVGFGLATATDSGLLQPGLIPASTASTAIPAGYVGHELLASNSTGTALGAANTYQAIASLTLTPGRWDISGLSLVSAGAGTKIIAALSTSPTADSAITSLGTTKSYGAYNSTAGIGGASIPPSRILVTTSGAYYLISQTDATGGSTYGNIRAVRAP